MVQFFGLDIFGRKVIVDVKSQLPVLNVDEGRSTLQILQVDVLEDPSVDDHVILHLDTEEVLGCVTRWIFFFEGLNILMSTLTYFVCADGLQVLLRSFHYSIQLLTFCLIPWNYVLEFEYASETLLRIPFSVIGRCSLVPISHWKQGKCTRIKLPHGFWYDFTESQAASCKYFQCQNRCFRVFRAACWRDFQN